MKGEEAEALRWYYYEPSPGQTFLTLLSCCPHYQPPRVTRHFLLGHLDSFLIYVIKQKHDQTSKLLWTVNCHTNLFRWHRIILFWVVLGESPPHCSFKNVFPVNCISIFFPQAYANTSMMFIVSLHSIDIACTSLSTYMYMRVPCPYTHTCIYV